VGAGLPLLLQHRLASYVYGPGGQILEQIAGSMATYYHAAQLGGVRADAGPAGAGGPGRYLALTSMHADRHAPLLG
jgi:hypothetical protein